MPGTLVVCLPQISVLSAGHKYMEPLQELPFVVSKPILEEGMFFHVEQSETANRRQLALDSGGMQPGLTENRDY